MGIEFSSAERLLRPSEGPSRIPPPSASALYTIPIGEGRYLIYAPVAGVAFVGNSSAASQLRTFLDDGLSSAVEPDLGQFFTELGLSGQSVYAPERSVADATINVVLSEQQIVPFEGRIAEYDGDQGKARLGLDAGMRSLDVAVRGALQMNPARLLLIYKECPGLLHTCEIIDASIAHVRHLTDFAQTKLELAVETAQPLRADEIEWIATNIDRVILRLCNVGDLLDQESLDSFVMTLSHAFAPSALHLSERRVPYSYVIALPCHRVDAIEELIKCICRMTAPFAIELNAGLSDESSSAESVEGAAALARLIARVRPVTDAVGCELVVPGARLEQPMTLNGTKELEWSVLANGRVVHCGPAIDTRESCRGCFAENHCLGASLMAADGTRSSVPGSLACHLVQEMTKAALLARIANAGGIAWSAHAR